MMRCLAYGLAVIAGLSLWIAAPNAGLAQDSSAQKDLAPEQRILPLDTFAGRADFMPPNGSAPEKKAGWTRGEAGACEIHQAEMTIRRDGTASFTALVSSLDTDDSYCVILDFFDRNQLQLFHFPRICSFTLNGSLRRWTRNDLAIPEHLYPFIMFATRQDHC